MELYLSDEWLHYAKALIILFFPITTMLIWTYGCRIKKLQSDLESLYQVIDTNRTSIVSTANFCHQLHASLDGLDLRLDDTEEQIKDLQEAVNILAASVSAKSE
jgi:bacterioferritin (cytochrome b1)